VEEILAKLAEYAADHPDLPWIRGNNFLLSAFPQGNPPKELIDRIIPDRPVVAVSADGHNSWVNSKALEVAGITPETVDPPYGRIERDPQTKAPTGTLRETAMDLVNKVLPPYTHAQRVEALRRSVQFANSYGLVGLVEANATQADVNAYFQLEKQDELTAYVNISLACDVAKGVEEAARVIQLHRALARGRSSTSLVRIDQVKIFLDGVVEGKTAALLEPYVGESHNGIANAEPETLNAVVTALDRAGLQIHIHAIGDRAIRMALDAFELARRTNGVRDGRHHIAHLQLVHPDDIARFGQLDVTANFQAVWATLEDTYMTQLTLPVLGPKRSEWQYPMGTIQRAGGRLVFGSDWSVTTLNPFHAAQVAVTRRGPDKQPRDPWTPQHLIDLESVLMGYTRNGAWITFREAESGTLEKGKLANLIVLDRDVLRASPLELFDTRVELTMFRGKVVFER
jgi:predicted amidohydrolase YtcJ